MIKHSALFLCLGSTLLFAQDNIDLSTVSREGAQKLIETKEQAEQLQKQEAKPQAPTLQSPRIQTKLTNIDIQFRQAIKLFNEKKYKESFDALSAIFMERLDDPRVNYYLGRAALEIKDYDQAAAAFERVLIINSDHARTRLELGRLYMETQQFELAEKEFKTVLDNKNLPDQVKANIEKVLIVIDNAKKRHFFTKTFILGTSYDTNPNSAIGNREYSVPYYTDLFSTNLTGDKPAEDMSFTTLGMLNHIYDYGDKGGWLLKNSLLFYKQTYRNYAAGNIDLISITTTPTYNGENFSASAAFGMDKIWYGQVALSNSFSIKPGLTYKINDLYSTSVTTGFKRTFYYYANLGKNADTLDFSVSFSRIFKETASLLKATFTFAEDFEHYNDEALSISRDDVSKSYNTYKLEYTSPVWKKKNISGSIAYTFKRTSYTNSSTSYYTKETEDQHVIGGKLFIPGTTVSDHFGKGSIFNVNYDFTHQRSNFVDSNYQKHLIGVNFIYSF